MYIAGNAEFVPRADIIVFRRAVDPSLASELGTLWDEFNGHYYQSGDRESIGRVGSMVRRLDALPSDHPLSVLGRSIIGEVTRAHSAVLNQQQPHAFQYWHPDGKTHPVAIIHAHDGGALDFVEQGADNGLYQVRDPEEGLVLRYAPPAYKTIEFEQGDVAVCTSPNSIHRGRNLTDDTRNTIVLFSR